jgi:hypothetical protein
MKRLLDEIVERAGRAAFEEACRVAWKAAPGTGKSDSGESGVIDLATDLSFWILDEMALASSERVGLLFAVYERMPCYSLIFMIPTWSTQASPEALALCQSMYRLFLGSDEDALAEPIGYSLWCGPFEGMREEVELWWRALAEGDGPPRLFERLLEHSGPVPYDLKEELYERLLPNEHFHPFIFRSLLFSRHDVRGQLDEKKARQLFRQLRLPPDTEGLEQWLK